MGRRIAKTIEGHTTYFLYTEEGLIAELNGQGNITKAYGWVTDTSYSTSPLWQAEPQAGETTISDLKQAQFHTLTTDHLGTVQMATNEAGQVTWKAQSEAFGKNTPDEQNQITMNLRFPGQYFDEETGTHYNYFRDYNPSIGRYIQRDPIGLNGGINVYAYAYSNSLKYVDPFGLITKDIFKRRLSPTLSCDMYILKTFIEGDVNAFVLALQQCQGIEPDVSLLELCERYALGKMNRPGKTETI